MENPANRSKARGKKLAITIFLNLLITAAQAVGGVISGSLSLLSDALHNLSDVISLVISYVANLLIRKKATFTRTFGFKRAEILAALINSTILLSVSILLIFRAIQRLDDPSPIGSVWVMALAGLGIVVNSLSAWLLYKDSRKNLNIRSAYLHLFTDTMTSVAVLAGGIVMYHTGYYQIDSILTIVIGIYLFYHAWRILTGSLRILMLYAPSSVEIEKIISRVKKIGGVENIHHIHVWQVNEEQVHLEAHIDFTQNLTLSQTGKIIRQIEELLKGSFGIDHVTLQPEFNVQDPKDAVRQEF